ncbi:uncharacterized protein FIESC28_06211 [Fusarium coffeatum]|uniref:BTB domain-containing protein n=1 Tax=Fusarium coffeatum TaxID=231269 RepID=A0A366RPB2_9HYPO|nr:uncharacterized protein FIESC28_06211 [Fusarium coffeatum]RBR18145.1 hypothetical protein FIESC28_06211 [Fusarium coffeatum]
MSSASITIDPNGDVVIVLRAPQHEDANTPKAVTPPTVETTVDTTAEDPSVAPEKTPTKSPAKTSSETSTETPTETPIQATTETATETTAKSVEDDATQSTSPTPAEAPTETSTETSAEPSTSSPTETPAETPAETPSQTPSIGTRSESNETTQTVTQNAQNQPTERHFICSKKHITFASRRAARQLTEDKWTLDKDFPLEPLTIVLKIIHGKTRDIPETVTLDLLADIASIVYYLECHDALTFFGRNWLSRYSTINLLCFMDKTLAQLIHISSVFENASLFENVTRIAIKSSSQVVPTYNLPIQSDILAAIGSKSSALIKILIDGLIDIQSKLLCQKLGCSYGCRSMLLGSLMQAMNAASIYPPPAPPSPFLILGSVIFSLRSALSPKYFSSDTDGPSSQHSGKWTLTMWPEQKVQPTGEKAPASNLFGTTPATAPATTSNLFGPKVTVAATPPVESASNIFGPKPTAAATPSTGSAKNMFGRPIAEAKGSGTSNIFGPKSTPATKVNDKPVSQPTGTGFYGDTTTSDPDQPWAIVRHHCCLQDFMHPLLDEVEAKIAGLKLADFARP